MGWSKADPFVIHSERVAREFLRTLHGMKTVPPATSDVKRLAGLLRRFARDRQIQTFDKLIEMLHKNNEGDQ